MFTAAGAHRVDSRRLVRERVPPCTASAVPGAVPGTVPQALYLGGKTGNPHFGFNSDKVIASQTGTNFTYSRTFPTPRACSSSGGVRCELVFDGVDTAATIKVNGRSVGWVENMHLQYVLCLTVCSGAGGIQVHIQIHITACT